MIFSITVLGSPYSDQSTQSALSFAKAAVDTGHKVYRVFFYHDGVLNGSGICAPGQNELNFPGEWTTLSQDHGVDLVVCIASALKRGIIDSTEKERYDLTAANLASNFALSGLGQLVDACAKSDRVITFGP